MKEPKHSEYKLAPRGFFFMLCWKEVSFISAIKDCRQ